MGDPRLDLLLKDFLERERKAPIEEIRSTLKTVTDRQLEHEQKDEERHRDVLDWRVSQERRVSGLEKDVEHLNKDIDRVSETTGNHNVAEIVRAARGITGSGRPPKSGLLKALDGELSKRVALAVVAALLPVLGWLAHHLQISIASSPASAATQQPPHP
jgi:hypothetical protein